MTDAIGCIDHIVIVVDDLDRDAEIYRRLGFTLSPKGVHSAAMGSANHTIMLRRDYFELLAVLTPTDRNLGWREALAAGGGVAGMAMTTEDAAAAYDYWKGVGLNPMELIRFARTVKRPSGPDMEARFEVVTLPDPSTAGLRLFVCSQPTREAVWLPELMEHANTAEAILGVTISTPDPKAAAAIWRRLVPNATVASTEIGARLKTGPHFIDLIDPKSAASHFGVSAPADRPRPIAIDYEVRDLERCRVVLAENGISFSLVAEKLVVPAGEACGVVLRFTKEPSSRITPN